MAVLRQVAQLCVEQNRYNLATKKFTQVGSAIRLGSFARRSPYVGCRAAAGGRQGDGHEVSAALGRHREDYLLRR